MARSFLAFSAINPAFLLINLLLFWTFLPFGGGEEGLPSVVQAGGVPGVRGEPLNELPEAEGGVLRTGVRSLLNHPPGSRDETELVAHVDGEVHLVDVDSGRSYWSFKSGPPLTSSYHRTDDGNDYTYSYGLGGKCGTDELRSKDDFYIYCGEDWDLYLYFKNCGSSKLAVSPEEFVSIMPHISDTGEVTIGSKKTTASLVNARNGKVIYRYGLDDDDGSCEVIGKEYEEKLDGPSKLIGTSIRPSTVQPVKAIYFTRTDYSLTSYAPNKTILWNMTVSEIEAAFLCSDMKVAYTGSSGNSGDTLNFEDEDGLKNPIKCQTRISVNRTRSPKVVKDGVIYIGLDIVPQTKLSVQQYSLDDYIKKLNTPRVLKENSIISYLLAATCSFNLPTGQGNFFAFLPSYGDKVEFENTGEPHGDDDSSRALTVYETNGAVSQSDKNFILHISVHFFLSIAIFLIILGVVFVSVRYNSKEPNVAKKGSIVGKKRRMRKVGYVRDAPVASLHGLLPQIENEEAEEQMHNKDLMLHVIKGNIGNGRMIGNLFILNIEIAKGSNGTVVLEGTYNGRPAAVKRLVRAHSGIANKEVEALLQSDSHPNIVRWYGVEYDTDFVYLALERCSCSLNDLIELRTAFSQDGSFLHNSISDTKSNDDSVLSSMKDVADIVLWKDNGYPSTELLGLMRGMIDGLAHLHDLKIIHRDLKPHNVLISSGKSVCAKLSDMGISKRLSDGKFSLTNNATGSGSSGWQAPELLLGRSQTFAVDLFSLGCVLFFCITKGKHPFGKYFERDTNIANNRLDLSMVESIPEAVHLFSQMLQSEPLLRPKAHEVLQHPLFWSSEIRMSFLRDSSDRIELEDKDRQCDLLEAVEQIGPVVFGDNWDTKFDPMFLASIGSHRRYNVWSTRHLLRLIRNKWNHYIEFPKEVQDYLGNMPDGFDDYLTSRFPNLLIEVYKVIYEYCREERYFIKYFKGKIR
ncbi:Serine/threonine-protein kinase/endoribonuclease [Nymphaea thermarum]|nr:Serine/threonine-protein kinase/endoribonuclease [Nymphaea thermarum]